VREVFNFFVDLLKNNLTDNSILCKITVPLGLNWKNLCDTKAKRLYLLTVTSSNLLYRGFIIFKKLFLWPFKLGIFSFLYSILGFDVNWFLNLFNIFYFNIPQWVYVKYKLLYCNGLNWWQNIVDIKSLKTKSIPFNNPKENLIKPNSNEVNNNITENKTKLYLILGAITLIVIGLAIYFNYELGGGNNPPTNQTENTIITVTDNQTPSEGSGSRGKGKSKNSSEIAQRLRRSMIHSARKRAEGSS